MKNIYTSVTYSVRIDGYGKQLSDKHINFDGRIGKNRVHKFLKKLYPGKTIEYVKIEKIEYLEKEKSMKIQRMNDF